jgi:pimeloyl-ACP methyl ester carboxylesterase
MPIARHVRLATGITVPTVETGDPKGVPVVCLHGYADSLRSFELMSPRLPRGLRVIAYSQRGHGDAERPAKGYAFANFVADAKAFLDALKLDRVVLIGHSMGSLVAQRLALDAPERLRAIVLIGSTARVKGNASVQGLWDEVLSAMTDPVDPAFVRAFQTGEAAARIAPAFQEVVVAESMKLPARVWRETARSLLEVDHRAELPRINLPTLIQWGDQDGLFGADVAEELKAALPRATFIAYPGLGHNMQWEDPARIAADIARFVERVGA